jgi:hypothetical protein
MTGDLGRCGAPPPPFFTRLYGPCSRARCATPAAPTCRARPCQPMYSLVSPLFLGLYGRDFACGVLMSEAESLLRQENFLALDVEVPHVARLR